MSGIKFALTDKQEETFTAYDARHKGIGNPLTVKQLATYGSLMERKYQGMKLSTGGVSFLDEIFQDFALGRYDQIFNNYMEKGVLNEEDSAAIYTRVTGDLLVTAKDNRKYNDWISGKYDGIVKKELVVDIKSSYERKTFPLTKTEANVDKIYFWQLTAYMWLTGMKKSRLAYVLTDSPPHIVDDELRKLDWKHRIFGMGGSLIQDPAKIQLAVQKVCNHTFTEEGLQLFLDNTSCDLAPKHFEGVFRPLSEEVRVKLFNFEYDHGNVLKIMEAIKLARNYLNRAYAASKVNYDLMSFNKRKEMFKEKFGDEAKAA
jgi:hypothetical protein